MSDVPTAPDPRNGLSVMQRLRQRIFLILLGTPSLESLRQISEDKAAWYELKNRFSDRIININIVAALWVSALASFLTTPPPTNFAKWNHEFPYFLIGAAYGTAAAAVVSGLCLLMFLNGVGPESIKQQKSTFKFTVLTMLLMTPVTLLFLAFQLSCLAWIAAVLLGDKAWMKVAMCAGFAVASVILIVISAAVF
ncbi:hypothetical protein EDC04DRAFT_2889325 [Pisolithus marmoratus]|nr:hypothetical protein EDC04DRAFT_2889325 [Pisolithus marmoratus]